MVSITSSYERSLDKAPNPNWASIHNAASADSYTAAIIYPAAYLSGGNFVIGRTGCVYDTSGIPAGAVLTQCRLYLYPTLKSDGDTDSICVVRHSTWSYPSNPPVIGDYNLSYWSTLLGTKTIASFTTGAWNYINLNLTSGINKGGSTRLYIVSKRDYDNNTPSGANYIYCDAVNKSYLDVLYTLGGKKKVAIIV